MDAVVMAGGMGRRLSKDEKPLTDLLGKPLIQYVLEALSGASNVDSIFVATSPRVERTIKWLHEFKKNNDNLRIIQTPGSGFVNDMIFSVEKAGIEGNVLITMADIPLVTSELLDMIIEKYRKVNTPALSVYNSLDICTKLGLRPDTVFHKNGSSIVPCGINILDVDNIHEEQEDHNLVLEDEVLAINVNTQEDLAVCRKIIQRNPHKSVKLIN